MSIPQYIINSNLLPSYTPVCRENMLRKFIPASTILAASSLFIHKTTQCDSSTPTQPTLNETYRKSLLPYLQREHEFTVQWIKDEEGWTKLPARAWPAYQPDIEEISTIEHSLSTQCPKQDDTKWNNECSTIKFNLATALVFNNHGKAIDEMHHTNGFNMYTELATQKDHADSKCAVGVILVEGLGTDANELEGLIYLRDAANNDRHPQALYELGTAYYAGIEDVLNENEHLAFINFAAASELGHYAGMFMTADCLMEGIGTEIDVERAVPLLFTAAISGHRYARQKVRELYKKYGDGVVEE